MVLAACWPSSSLAGAGIAGRLDALDRDRNQSAAKQGERV
jgi:hypothetical protein